MRRAECHKAGYPDSRPAGHHTEILKLTLKTPALRSIAGYKPDMDWATALMSASTRSNAESLSLSTCLVKMYLQPSFDLDTSTLGSYMWLRSTAAM